jgi:hypothetical protein
VRAVPQLLPSLKAWESNQKVQQRAAGPDSWGHPAATWEQAFTRSYKVANYLLGQTPLPLKLTLLLVPDGSVYDKTVVQTGVDYVPITLAFYFPSEASETDALTASRFSALVAAMTTSAYEYQHIFVFTETIKPIGNNKADKAINDEARSQCWSDSVFLALTSGTHTESKWDAAQETVLTETGRDTSAQTKRQPNDGGIERRYSDAWRWGRYLEAKNVSAYLLARGRRDAKVLSNEPEATNAVMSMCRAITQHPLDLTAGEYPTSQVEYVPFFPSGLSPQKPGSPNPD